jgi:hypothetical protein
VIPTRNLETVMLYTSRSYTMRLDATVTVGTLAQFLSQQEAYINANTLEIARPVDTSSRLHDLDLHPGDRIAIFSQPATPQRPPTRVRPGDKMLVFSRGDYQISSYGKHGILVGKPDSAHHTMPDVDIRNFIIPDMLEYVSRGCLWLNFDDVQKVWYATRLGDTRIMIDEFEIGSEKIALTADCLMQFYRGQDNPRAAEPIGAMRIQVRNIESEKELVSVKEGNYPVRVHVGTERSGQMLNASENIPLGQIVTSLAIFNKVQMTETMQVYLMRLVAPNTSLNDLRMLDDEFLYVSLRLDYANNLLILRDSHEKHVFELQAGRDDETRILGSRGVLDNTKTDLDVDLFDAVATHTSGRKALLPLRQGYIDYRAGESAWYLRLAESARIPMFVNNVRVSTNPTRLLSGDVLTIGRSVADYFVRLEIELTSKSG